MFVLAKSRDKHNKNWGLLVSWSDTEGVAHQMVLPNDLLYKDQNILAQILSNQGLPIHNVRLLHRYLLHNKQTKLATVLNTTGWNDSVFAFPDDVIKNEEENTKTYFFSNPEGGKSGMKCLGSLEDWKNNVATLAIGNYRLIFAISVSFAAPLARFVNESGGFHFVGTSSLGKTTLLDISASVWGQPNEFSRTWNSTKNGIEGFCASRNDLPSILDEIGMADPKDIGESIYMIGNGQGKARATRYGMANEPLRWSTLILSSGEKTFAEHLKESGKKSHAGQETRLINIAANAESGFGIYETLTGNCKDGHALSTLIKEKTRQCYGVVGRAFIRGIVADRHQVESMVQSGCEDFMMQFVPNNACGQVKRVAHRFALVAVAGELATSLGLTGWHVGDVVVAVEKLFGQWLLDRGGTKELETVNAIMIVRSFLEKHGNSRFELIKNNTFNQMYSSVIDRAGYRDEQYFYIFPSVFREEICRGLNEKAVLTALVDEGVLVRQRPDRYTHKKRLPHLGNEKKLAEVYMVNIEIFGSSPDE